MLTGLAFGHCTAEVVEVAVVYSQNCRTEDDNDHGVENVYQPALTVPHSSKLRLREIFRMSSIRKKAQLCFKLITDGHLQ